jgi:hypothetical protein
MFIGSWLSGKVVDMFSFAAGAETHHMWDRIWLVPAAGAAAVLILFALFFSSREESAGAVEERVVLSSDPGTQF